MAVHRFLKPEYQEKSDEFHDVFEYYGCSCLKRAPCNYCTHEGNPANLEENEDAWVTAGLVIPEEERPKPMKPKEPDHYGSW